MSQQATLSDTFATASGPSSSYTKYASLPDVDTSAPDVFESEGLTRANDARSSRQRSRKQRSQGDDDADSDSSSDDSDRTANRKHPGDGTGGLNDDIDSSSLRRNDAAAKFRGATDLDADGTDFSGRLKGRRSHKGKATRPRDAGLETNTYVIDASAQREKESAVDRLRRLKFEASQLEEELNSSAATSVTGEAASTKVVGEEQVDSAEVLAQLKVLQDQLAKLPSPSTSAASMAGSYNVDKEALRTLLQQVKQPPSSAEQTVSGSSDPAAASQPTAHEGRPADMVTLEARLTELESTLGLQQALLDESAPVPRPVLSTLSRLEHQLSLLSQPRHLDAISRRVKVLVTEMDRVHDVRRKLTDAPIASNTDSSSTSTSTSTLTPAEITKLQHLFEVSTRLEPLLPLLPGVLTRLQTLSELHSSAAHFGSSLDEIEQGREAMLQQEQELDQLLRKMEVNMEQNRNKVEANLVSLQERIEDVAARLERVSR
ncbi:uncharacterized protein UTRI_05067_B [Ustilago trichophora]|uniref:Dynactin subunit 2 n=1 Tax=Ustilago trichophora TaxID=86804 RepID=A0A5C3EHD1_9BASI|nr:uncharacterized protein UTRI_05067_B [Ustilago trichophora]